MGNPINAKREALQPRDLSSAELDALSGGWAGLFVRAAATKAASKEPAGEAGSMNDNAQMFQAIMQQLTN